MKLAYLLLDVFTSEPLKGNPLAVVQKADGLLDDQMQAIAREFNLSETVFICRPKSERHTAAVRIFTPEVELPFAGHPSVGAAWAVLDQALAGTRGGALVQRCDRDAAFIENVHKVCETTTTFAQEVFFGNLDVVQRQGVGIGRVPANLVVSRFSSEAGCLSWDDDR